MCLGFNATIHVVMTGEALEVLNLLFVVEVKIRRKPQDKERNMPLA